MVRWLYECDSSSSSSVLSSRPMSGSTRDSMGEEDVEAEEEEEEDEAVVDVVEAECFRIRACARCGCVVRVGMREADVGDAEEDGMVNGEVKSQRWHSPNHSDASAHNSG